MEGGKDSFSRVLNAALLTEDRSTLERWFPFLKLFGAAVNLLPSLRQVAWRGVRWSMGEQCKQG